ARARDERQTRQAARFATADPEARRVEHEGEGGAVAGGEAVQLALFEPRHLVGRQPGELGGGLDGQLAAQACGGQRGSLPSWVQCGYGFHARDHSAGGGWNLSGRSSAKSTSPGGPRSSQGTRRAGSGRAP